MAAFRQEEIAFIMKMRDQVSKNAKTAGKNIRKMGKDADRAGDDVKRKLIPSLIRSKALMLGLGVAAAGLALGAAFAIGLKNAIEFEKQLVKIKTLTAANTQQVALYKQELAGLSERTGKTLPELGNGLFVVNSAGVLGKEALDTLEISAKASAAGLGETDEIARTTAATLYNYADANFDAAKAVSTIVKISEQGNFEISELSGSLANVLPSAKAAKVSFNDTGAAIAVMTKAGKSAPEAITSLRQLFIKLNTPSEQGIKVMKEYGLSVEGIQEKIQKDGLLAALAEVNGAVGKNGQAWKKLVEDANAVDAVQILLSEDRIPETIATFEELNSVVGDETSKVFEEYAKTSAFKIEQANITISNSFTKLSSIALPLVAKGMEIVTSVVVGFRDKLSTVRQGIVDFVNGGIFYFLEFTKIVINSMAEAGIAIDKFFAKIGDLGNALTTGVAGTVLTLSGVLSKEELDAAIALAEEKRQQQEGIFSGQTPAQIRADAQKRIDEITAIQNRFNGESGGNLTPEEKAVVVAKIGAYTQAIKDEIAKNAGQGESVPIDLTGSGNTKKDPIAEAIKKRRAEVESIKDKLEALKLVQSGEEKSLAIAELRIQAAKALSEEERGLINQQIAAQREYTRINEQIEENRRLNEDAADAISGAFGNIITGAESVKDALASMARQLADVILQATLLEPLKRSISGSLGGGGSSPFGFLGSLFFAKGAAFNNGTIIPHARGGVTSGPSYFPMSGNKTGLMGEAGPEAILPLTRLPGGDLGVKSMGGGGNAISIPISVNVTIEGGGGAGGQSNPQDAERMGKQIADTISAQFYSLVDKESRPGGRLYGAVNSGGIV